VNLVLEVQSFSVERLNLLVEVDEVLSEFLGPDATLNIRLSLWQTATLPLHQDVLSVLLQLFVAEGLGATLINNLAIPSILATHTVSIIAGIQKVPLNTHTADLQITKGAINLFVIGLVEALAAYTAVAHLTYMSWLFFI
tara:strand:+ start:348 stop:767 length:420 start_codon:yes stop_codon:yes gene_type:complete